MSAMCVPCVYAGLSRTVFNGRIILFDKVILNELDNQCRLANAASTQYNNLENTTGQRRMEYASSIRI